MIRSFFAPLAIKIFSGVTLALLIAVAVLYFRAEAADAKRVLAEDRLETANDTIDELQLDLAIMETASVERAEDDQRNDDQRRELDNASNTPGDSPADSRLRRLCVLKRQQSGSAGLPPQCSRFDLEG